MTRTRMPMLDETALTAEQQPVFDAIARGKRGVVQGPLRVWLQSPTLADRAQALGSFCRYDTQLAPRLSELAVLVTGAFWRSGFEWAVHAPIAVDAGLAEDVVEAIRLGDTPAFERDDEAVVHAFSRQLHEQRRVDDGTYWQACDILGQQTVVELVGLLGYYTLISMTINAFEVPVPENINDPFK